jgi:hypothetical protein
MTNTSIKLKKSSVSGKIPLVSDIDFGELAINYADGKLYYKHSDTSIRSFLDSGQILYLIDSDYLKNIINSTYIIANRPINLLEDSNPSLGGDLNLNGHIITDSGSSGSIDISGNITGGTITGTQFISTNNGTGTNYKIGDDAWIGDINLANTARISGVQDSTQGYIVFGNSNGVALGRSGTGPLTYGGTFSAVELTSTNASGDEGGQINLAVPVTNTTLGGTVTVDVYQNKLRFFEGSVNAKGAYIDLSACANGVGTNLLTGATGDPFDSAAANSVLDSAVSNGTGLSYSNGTISIANTGVIAGTYGSASLVPVFTINAQGQIDSAGTVSVAGVSSTDWDSTTGNFIISTADGGSYYTKITLDPYTTSNLDEGTNLYYTTARADSAFDVRLATKTTTNLNEGTNKYYTSVRADSDARHAITGSTGISYSPSTGVLTTNDAQIVHDNLSGFVADEHIDHNLVSIIAGNGLTGGGAITASRTISIDSSQIKGLFSAGTGVSYNSGTGAISIGQAVGAGDTPTFNGLSAGSAKITSLATPTLATDAANKSYVDTIAAASLHYHDPVRLESPVNLSSLYDSGTAGVGATLTNSGSLGRLVVDGVTANLNDRILVYQQTNGAHNGIYDVTTVGDSSTNWVLTRSSDADTYAASSPSDLGKGDAFYVKEGLTGAGELYVMNTAGTITFGVTPINFSQISSAQIYKAGNGLLLNGVTFSIDSSATVISVNSLKGNITSTNLLDAIKTVDGATSGLDADLLDGQHGSYYRINVYDASGTLLN